MRSPDRHRSRLVLLGTSRYEHDRSLCPLPAVRRTVADLATTLTHPRVGIVAPHACVSVLDERSLPVIGRRLRQATEAAEDLLLVYFAGHGLVGGRRHALHLGLYHSHLDDPAFSALAYETLRDTVLESPAATKLIILDCCFSGRALTDTMGAGAAAVVDQLDVSGTYVLTSAQHDQVSLVRPGERYTAFSGRLLQVLRHGVPGGPAYLTIEHVYQRVAALMRAEGLSTPQRRTSQTAGVMALARNPARLSRGWGLGEPAVPEGPVQPGRSVRDRFAKSRGRGRAGWGLPPGGRVAGTGQ